MRPILTTSLALFKHIPGLCHSPRPKPPPFAIISHPICPLAPLSPSPRHPFAVHLLSSPRVSPILTPFETSLRPFGANSAYISPLALHSLSFCISFHFLRQACGLRQRNIIARPQQALCPSPRHPLAARPHAPTSVSYSLFSQPLWPPTALPSSPYGPCSKRRYQPLARECVIQSRTPRRLEPSFPAYGRKLFSISLNLPLPLSI